MATSADKLKSKEKKRPVKRERGHVHEQVLQYMRRGLMVGAFLPGQVMSLRKVAASLGTSPMPVREVMSRLVAANALEETESGSVKVPRLSIEKLSDLFAVRELLEGSAAELAVKNANAALISELSAVNKALIQAINKRNILDCLSLNQKFHFDLYAASKSEVLLPLIESLWLQFGPTMYMSLLVPSMPWDASAHRVILQELKASNAGGVKRAIVTDIRNTKQALITVKSTHGAELLFANAPLLEFSH